MAEWQNRPLDPIYPVRTVHPQRPVRVHRQNRHLQRTPRRGSPRRVHPTLQQPPAAPGPQAPPTQPRPRDRHPTRRSDPPASDPWRRDQRIPPNRLNCTKDQVTRAPRQFWHGTGDGDGDGDGPTGTSRGAATAPPSPASRCAERSHWRWACHRPARWRHDHRNGRRPFGYQVNKATHTQDPLPRVMGMGYHTAPHRLGVREIATLIGWAPSR
jgi:hypothetical protein